MQAKPILLHMSTFLELGDRTWNVRLSELCGRVRFATDWSSGEEWWKTLRDFDLWFVWSGRGTMQIEQMELPISAGTCIWKRPGRRYITHHDPAHPLRVNFFHFNLLDGSDRPPGMGFTPPFEHMRVQHLSFTDGLMQRILALPGEPAGNVSATRLFAALLAELVRETQYRPPAATSLRQEHIEKIQTVMSEIRLAPAQAYNVAILAKKHGYSVSHFSRLFATVAGKRPQQFVIDVRLDLARDQLALTQDNIGTIAARCGFNDIYYFSRLFKQRLGVSPSTFRRHLAQS